MNKTFKLLAAAALLSLTSMTASAGIISFTFENSGSLDSGGSCGTGCKILESSGTAKEISGLPGVNEWSFTGTMKVFEGVLGVGQEPGYGWSFNDLNGNDSLFGSFTAGGSLLTPIGASLVSYTVLGGTGLFDGAVGRGDSWLISGIFGKLDGFLDGFYERGEMTVYTKPVSTPEPALTTLLIAGLGMMGFMAYRRRREANQI